MKHVLLRTLRFARKFRATVTVKKPFLEFARKLQKCHSDFAEFKKPVAADALDFAKIMLR